MRCETIGKAARICSVDGKHVTLMTGDQCAICRPATGKQTLRHVFKGACIAAALDRFMVVMAVDCLTVGGIRSAAVALKLNIEYKLMGYGCIME